MSADEFEKISNTWAASGIPFIFIIDFEIESPIVVPLQDTIASGILFSVNGITNSPGPSHDGLNFALTSTPEPLSVYKKKFDLVQDHLFRGDSFLTNLTIRTEVDADASLTEIFHRSGARYKLVVDDQFLVFSPETFVQVKNNRIYTFPMKGTIDASVPDAPKRLLQSVKELAEHVTIVDLLRNDLSQVATSVSVEKFRYIEQIATSRKRLLQASSRIAGDLAGEYINKPGSLLLRLLPAGSVSGAPKKRTVEIIKEAEGIKRGYYTGVFGIWKDGELDSGVMIRYIERADGKLYYRSGGGITTQSICEAEYQEAIDKIYVPLS